MMFNSAWTSDTYYRERTHAHESLARQAKEDARDRAYLRGKPYRDALAAAADAAIKRVDAINRLERALNNAENSRGDRNGR